MLLGVSFSSSRLVPRRIGVGPVRHVAVQGWCKPFRCVLSREVRKFLERESFIQIFFIWVNRVYGGHVDYLLQPSPWFAKATFSLSGRARNLVRRGEIALTVKNQVF